MWLITGATGLVGGMLAEVLPGEIVAMSRRQMPGAGWVCGDIARDGFGFDAGTKESLQRRITGIVHCAADVRFTAPLDQARNVNTAGTGRLLDFARGCGKLRAFAHVSTVYVLGGEEKTLPEGRAQSARWISTYEQSKYEAEEVALDAARTLPVAIYRLSSIVGDAATGRVRQFNHVHQMLRLMPRKLLPAIPGEADALMDLIPSDAAIQALAHLIRERCEAGTVWNVCSGEERSWTLEQIIEEAVRAYHDHGQPICGPRLVKPAQFASVLHRFGGLTQDLLNVASNFLPHLGLHQRFACERSSEELARVRLGLPHVSAYFARVMRYCFESRWGNEPINDDADVGAVCTNGRGAEIISAGARLPSEAAG